MTLGGPKCFQVTPNGFEWPLLTVGGALYLWVSLDDLGGHGWQWMSRWVPNGETPRLQQEAALLDAGTGSAESRLRV